jgi:molybdenum cofactor cytidylyltransferase
MLPTAIILLAAGCSSRLGRPKQLLPYGKHTLLRHAADTAMAAGLGPVMIVLGAVENECRPELSGLPVTILSNPIWEEGMGGSIAVGARHLDEAQCCAAIVMLCDQPGITPAMLRALASDYRRSGKSMVASSCDGVLGPPALFAAQHFPQLRSLRGSEGARSLFQNAANISSVVCPEAAWDIDTEADAAALQYCSSGFSRNPATQAPPAEVSL